MSNGGSLNGKTLIFSQCLIRNEQEGRLLGVCMRLIARLNPGIFMLLIDNASPREILSFLPTEPAINIYRFPDQIGHFSPKFRHERHNHKDGPGRAMMTGLQMAIDGGYKRVAYIESDCLLARSVEYCFALMATKTAGLPKTKWGYVDTNVFLVNDVPWLKAYEFIEEYDWPNQTGIPEGEVVYKNLLGHHLGEIPLAGRRADGFSLPDGRWIDGYIKPDNIRHFFPEGVDFITHCSTETFAEFLKINGHPDLAGML